MDGIGKRWHVSDGLLIFPDGRQVAIEVMFGVKGKQRIDGILKAYASQLEIKEIWYFCNQSAYTALAPRVAKKSYIKLFSIKEFLA